MIEILMENESYQKGTGFTGVGLCISCRLTVQDSFWIFLDYEV